MHNTIPALSLGLGIAILIGCGSNQVMIATPIDPTLPPAKSLEEIIKHPHIRHAVAEYDMAVDHKALAISEDGYWGMAKDYNSTEWAAWEAVRDCSAKLEVLSSNNNAKMRGCFLYQLDDEIFTQPTSMLSGKVAIQAQKLSLYTIDLGSTAEKAHAHHVAKDPRHKAFAVSPRGEWGYGFEFGHPDDAVDHAVKLCNTHLSLRDGACVLYSLNGIVLPK
ncbi:MAG: hypothetical protein HRT36_03085 [Alphaproteobacteria bacterium]|nr:hypothetical protein [Alphaproteobacteria bacterium]